MAIDGFSYTIIVDGRVDPDSPLDTTLFTDIRNNFEFLQKWLGKSFIGAAVADHNHDGANSKKIKTDDLDPKGIDNGFVWVDSGTNIGLSTGVKDISSLVPVDTVFVQLHAAFSINSASAFQINGGIVSGTMRKMISCNSVNPTTNHLYGGIMFLPVDGSRQIEISVSGSPSGQLLEMRSYAK